MQADIIAYPDAVGEHPKDPRVVHKGRHRERGDARFSFTYADIARCAGIAKKTAQNAAALNRFDPENLDSVISFVLAHRARLARRRERNEG